MQQFSDQTAIFWQDALSLRCMGFVVSNLTRRLCHTERERFGFGSSWLGKYRNTAFIFSLLVCIAILTGCGKTLRLAEIHGDPQTPHLIWTIKTRGSLLSSPVIQQDHLYVPSLDQRIYKIDLLQPRLVWKKKFKSHPRFIGFPTDSTLITISDLPDVTVYSIHARTRKKIWECRVGETDAGFAIQDSMLFISTNTKRLIALDVTTGRIKWKYQINDFIRTKPLVSGPLVLVGTDDNRLLALDTVTGNLKWSLSLNSAIEIDLLPLGDKVAVVAENDTLYVVSAQDGQVKWRTYIEGISLNTPIAYNDLIIVHSMKGKCIAVNKENGQIQWQTPAPNLIATPVIYQNTLIFVQRDHGLITWLDLETRQKIWEHDLKEIVHAPPLVWNDVLLVASADHKVYAYQLKKNANQP